jgi:serine/threonine protein kinase
VSDITTRLRSALEDRYRIEEEIGRGGAATVYLAEDLKHTRKVAIKVLRPGTPSGYEPQRFLREIRIAARLAHPQILPLHDSGECDGLLYFVMPYAGCESLRDRLQRDGPLPVDVALRITRAVAGALGYAHRLEFIHRDIKPENILLQEGEPVVADFGVATAVSAASGDGAYITDHGFAVGTPASHSAISSMPGSARSSWCSCRRASPSASTTTLRRGRATEGGGTPFGRPGQPASETRRTGESPSRYIDCLFRRRCRCDCQRSSGPKGDTGGHVPCLGGDARFPSSDTWPARGRTPCPTSPPDCAVH